MNKTINQYINQLHLDPKREAAVRKLVESVSQSSGNNSGGNTNPELEFIDLGLPSGTLWCSCNLGANSPEELGNLYMWGDPTPYTIIYDENNSQHKVINPEGVEITYDNRYMYYKFIKDGKLIKYNGDANLGENLDFITELQPLDDIAYLYNKEYRTPSITEIKELINNTYVEKIETEYDYSKLKVISKVNNNYIYVYSFSFITDIIFWSNSLIKPNYGGTSYDVAAAAYTPYSEDILNLGGNRYYGTFYRFVPSFIRPVKFGNINSNHIVNVDLEYFVNLDKDSIISNNILYAKLLNAHRSYKPVFDIYTKSFIQITEVNANNEVIAIIQQTGDYIDGDNKVQLLGKKLYAKPNGEISIIYPEA